MTHRYGYQVAASDAATITERAHDAARAYWGDRPYLITITSAPSMFDMGEGVPAHRWGYTADVTTTERTDG